MAAYGPGSLVFRECSFAGHESRTGMGGAIAYDIELLPYPLFIPPGSQLAERDARYANGAYYLLDRMAGPGITGQSAGRPYPFRQSQRAGEQV